MQAIVLHAGFELRLEMIGQKFALPSQSVDEGSAICFDALVERGLLELMPVIGTVAKAMPINTSRFSLPCANMLIVSRKPERAN